ncbi:helix-turn-helix domain-containing protein [Paenibacillus naphthalenovorans]|uniref:helix-turn-helix domain-containing protein n=1 Tax=Paenibacillus naphthalenovorans TaxID=162209 RepID=UPI003D2A42C8
MDIRAEFGQRVRELRARCGMSQEMLAHRAGLDRTYISGVERGKRNISIVNIEKKCLIVTHSFQARNINHDWTKKNNRHL